MESDKISNRYSNSSKYGSVKNNFLNPLNFKLHNVDHDETVMSIAVKYDVSVDELKKLNGLWNDQVIYKKELKIPTSNNSNQMTDYETLEQFLTESTEDITTTANSSQDKSKKENNTNSIKTRSPSANQLKSNEIGDYFAKFDNELKQIKSSLQSRQK